MSHIFISYARKDMDFAGKIAQALADNKLDTWIDWKDIPKGEDWEQEIYRGIEEAEAFLFLITPDSVYSRMCKKEIKHALKNGKRIIPIIIRDTNLTIIPRAISKLNWIFCRDKQDKFKNAIKQMQQTIHTDYEWIRFHTELQVKALRWERRADNSRLLRGKELRECEEQLTSTVIKEPQPTDLQRQYVLTSRRNEERLRSQTTIMLSIGLGTMVILSLVALTQRNEAFYQRTVAQAASTRAIEQQMTAEAERNLAEQKARISKSNELAGLSKSSDSRFPARRILLAIESLLNLKDGFDPPVPAAEQAVREALNDFRGEALQQTKGVIAFRPDETAVAIGQSDGKIILYDVTYESFPEIIKLQNAYPITRLIFSPDGKWLIVESATGFSVWDVREDNPISWKSIKYFPSFGNVRISIDSEMLVAISENQILTLKFNNIDESKEILDSNKTIKDVQISSNLQLVIISTDDGFIGTWDIINDSEKKIAWDYIADDAINAILLNPQGNLLVSVSTKEIKIWNFDKSRIIAPAIYEIEHLYSGDNFTDVRISDQGKWLVYKDGIVLLAKDLNQIEKEPLRITATIGLTYSVSPSERIFVSVLGGGSVTGIIPEINVMDVSSEPNLYYQKIAGNEGYIDNFYFSYSGRWLATSGSSGIRIYDFCFIGYDCFEKASTGHISRFFDHYSLYIDNNRSSIKNVIPIFSPDGKWMILSKGKDIRLWDTNNLLVEAPSIVFESDFDIAIHCLSKDGGRFVTVGNEGHVKLWNWTNIQNTKSYDIFGFQGKPIDISISNDNRWLAISNDKGIVFLWDITQQVNNAPQTLYGISSFLFSPDNDKLVTADNNNNVFIYKIEDAKTIRVLGSVKGLSYWYFITRDGKWLLTTDPINYHMNIWAINSQGIVYQELKNQYLTSSKGFAISNDGRFLLTTQEKVAYIWDFDILSRNEFGQTQPIYEKSSAYIEIAGISPNSRKFAFGSSEGYWVYDLAENTDYLFSTGFTRFTTQTIITNDYLLIAASGQGAKIWNLNFAENPPIALFAGGVGSELEISHNQKWLLEVGLSGEPKAYVEVWDLTHNHAVQIACEVAGRNLRIDEWKQYFPNEPYHITCQQWPAGE